MIIKSIFPSFYIKNIDFKKSNSLDVVNKKNIKKYIKTKNKYLLSIYDYKSFIKSKIRYNVELNFQNGECKYSFYYHKFLWCAVVPIFPFFLILIAFYRNQMIYLFYSLILFLIMDLCFDFTLFLNIKKFHNHFKSQVLSIN